MSNIREEMLQNVIEGLVLAIAKSPYDYILDDIVESLSREALEILISSITNKADATEFPARQQRLYDLAEELTNRLS